MTVEEETDHYYPGAACSPVTCVRIVRHHGGRHASLTVWNRGANAGLLTVLAEDAEVISQRLLQLPEEEEV